jgi:hypothetical protein
MTDLYLHFSQIDKAHLLGEATIRHCLVRASHQFETEETRASPGLFKRLSMFFRSKHNHRPKKSQPSFRRS